MQIRIDEIIPTASGRADAFEELTCQLARRHPPAQAVEFRRIYGAGGDGGIEGYWVLEDGKEIGYQAKYYLRSGDVNWSAINQSVQTALTRHPQLRSIVISLACDLTDRTIRKGKTGWEKWGEYKSEWEAQARSMLGHEVAFDIWTAAEIRDMLGLPPMAGLLARWFGALAIESDWCAQRVNGAIADLDERYHAEDHVPVSIEGVFDVLVRGDKAVGRFLQSLVRIKELEQRHLGLLAGDDAERARGNVARVLAISAAFEDPSWIPWQSIKWVQLTQLAQGSLAVLATSVRDEARRAGGFRDAAQTTLRQGLAQLSGEIAGLERAWSRGVMIAENARAVLLTGRGGAGKSHLLAGQAQRAIDEGRPALLVLGQHLRAGSIWPQILSQLGIDGPPERFLQAFDSAAEAVGKRALFLVDALNEGAGPSLWRNQIAGFLATLGRYQNIVCVLSCRSEYLPYLLPKTVEDQLCQFEVRGFETPAEQQGAANVYMDRKGIARPTTPWLAEEFRNPLFLRSVCVALQRDGKNEFPRGLVGIKRILAFYIASVARHIAQAYEGTELLVAPVRTTLASIARAMATKRRDYISRTEADEITRTIFASFAQPDRHTWLEVLHRSGLVRFDPDPDLVITEGDSLCEVDVVRFSFQRFQDQLMAEALLANHNIDEVFSTDGALHFLTDQQQSTMLGPGLIGALAIQIPELYGRELIDLLPGGFKRWKSSPVMRLVFVDSIRLRAASAFNSRTSDLLEQWIAQDGSAISLLIEVSVVADHPWNAEAMHARLVETGMPERDLRWTLALNEMNRDDESHGLNVLCRWCASPQAMTSLVRTRELAALTLAWCLTSSNRPVRDTVTKALSNLMLAQLDLLTYLVKRLRNVDDNYVLERVWAAAFGACSHAPTIERLKIYATTAIGYVFEATPRKNLLLRDYAKAIIEMAINRGVGFDDRILSLCAPPYNESFINLFDAPNLHTASEDTRLTTEAKRIIWSCMEYGDFGSYEIKASVSDITNIALKALPICTKESAFRHFKLVVLNGDFQRIAAFYKLQEHLREMRMPTLVSNERGFILERKNPSRIAVNLAEVLQQNFTDLLSPEELQCFMDSALPWLADSYSAPAERVDVERCQAWVAMRAIELAGCALEVEGPSESSRERPIIERLGKKYQWLALSELLCGLTSEFCIESGSQEDRTLLPYNFPTELGFLRDIDPTILSITQESSDKDDYAWMFGDDVAFEEAAEETLTSWPMQEHPGANYDKDIVRVDADGKRWLVLYDHRHRTAKYNPKQGEHGMRQQAFRRIFSVFVETAQLEEFVTSISSNKNVNVSHWEVPDLTDGPYFGEIPWRATVPQGQWSDRGVRLPANIRLAFPLYRFVWESHLDLSLADGARSFRPAPWLASMLGLDITMKAADELLDSNGRRTLLCKTASDDDVVLLNEDAFDCLQREAGLSCVWVLVAERNAWPGGSNVAATWRRVEGVAWTEKSRVVAKTWSRDGAAAVRAQPTEHGAEKNREEL